ncbi:hypothetical protein P3T76_000940 [Phytophthora citrophthora]|uniref:Transmembrane protein n=1 Tax=Phytophthora citrophthora TaxID=4793 RepID=A0AAD9GXM8_9STRA|nr:hypothetical protein P3T76_000940 [Phytophthora citrophthora]
MSFLRGCFLDSTKFFFGDKFVASALFVLGAAVFGLPLVVLSHERHHLHEAAWHVVGGVWKGGKFVLQDCCRLGSSYALHFGEAGLHEVLVFRFLGSLGCNRFTECKSLPPSPFEKFCKPWKRWASEKV